MAQLHGEWIADRRCGAIAVFVYGTLKPGEANYVRYCGGRVDRILDARTRGRLFDLHLGYPAAVAESGDRGWVSGYLLQFEDRGILNSLDALEGYWPGRSPQFNEYQRRFVPVRSPLGKPRGFPN
ncbi:MAG: gamma-glutamylcyclotransferase family protein, partial [Cyanobacteria bacterium J06641_5]